MLVTTILGITADYGEKDNASGLLFALIGVVVHFPTTTNATTFIALITLYAVLPPVELTALILANTPEDALWLGPFSRYKEI